jgi:AbrB family looped-hinge helix DNA binding protein
MFGKPEFYGSTTVGAHGQVVLPATLRKKLKIEVGDKFLVMAQEHGQMGGIMLVKAEVLDSVMGLMSEQIRVISKTIKESEASDGSEGGSRKGQRRSKA